MAVSFGKPDGSHVEQPLFKNKVIIELTGEGAYDFVNLPIPPTNLLSFGTGAATKYPSKLEDGVILAPASLAAMYTNNNLEDEVTSYIGNIPTTKRYGDEFFNFATNGAGVWYMVFTGNTFVVTGSDNQLHNYDESVDPFAPLANASAPFTDMNINYDAGRFDSQAITGLKGSFEVWLPGSLVYENSVSSYNVGDYVSISKGRIKKGASTEIAVGTVKRKSTTGTVPKILVALNTDMKMVIA